MHCAWQWNSIQSDLEGASDAVAGADVELHGGGDASGMCATVADVVALGTEAVEDGFGAIDRFACASGSDALLDADVESADGHGQTQRTVGTESR